MEDQNQELKEYNELLFSKNNLHLIFNEINTILSKNGNKYNIKEIDIKLLNKCLNFKNMIISKKSTNNNKINIILRYYKKRKYKHYIKNCISIKYILFIILILYKLHNIPSKNIIITKKYTTFIKNVFLLILKLFDSQLLSFNHIIIIYNFYIDQILKDDYNLKTTEIIVLFMSVVHKFMKYLQKNNLIKSANKEINTILKKLFSVLGDVDNKKLTNYNMRFIFNIYNHYEFLKFTRFMTDDNISISDENKILIKTNLTKILCYNFSLQHLNYFYHLIKKYILKFNNYKNSDEINSSIKYKSLSELNENLNLIIEVIKAERRQQNNNEFYFNITNGFYFNSSSNNCYLKSGEIKFNSNEGLCIIFSFYLIDNNIQKSKQIILSVKNEKTNKNILNFILDKGQIYINIYDKKDKKDKIFLTNISYNKNYLLIFYYDHNLMTIYINEDKINKDKKIYLNKIDKISIEIGCEQNKSDNKNFNGIIGSIIIFNSIISNYIKIFDQIIKLIKNNYYLLGENDFNLSLLEYYGISKDNYKVIKNIKEKMGNLILYLNSDIIQNKFGHEDKKAFRDFQDYNNIKLGDDINMSNKNTEINYFFNEEPKLELFSVFPFTKNNLIFFFQVNYGYNFLVLIIEYIYNILLVLSDITDLICRKM